MKKTIVFLCVLLMLAVLPANAQTITPTIVVDGKIVFTDVPPFIENGRVLVPLRSIFDALGGELDWIAEEKRVIGFKGPIALI